MTQAELARRAGVSRQLVAAVEGGRHAPAVDAALGLAQALGASVEELFAEPAEPEVISALGARLGDGAQLRVGRVGSRLVAAELPDHGVAGTGWASPDAIWDSGRLQLLTGAIPAGLVIAGCDPAFGIAERMLEGLGERSMLALTAPTGVALEALAEDRIHAAVVHGRDDGLPEPPVAVARWHVARWQVGLAVSPRLRASSVGAVLGAGAPVAQRHEAAASQQAFDRARLAAGVDTAPRGRLAGGHLDAARIAALLGGAGVSTESAARAFRLDFLAIEDHTVELWVSVRWLDHPGTSALLELLSSSAFTQRIGQFGGYELDRCGTRV